MSTPIDGLESREGPDDGRKGEMSMEIVVIDGYTLSRDDLPWDRIEKLGNLTVYDRMETDGVVKAAEKADIILVNKVKIPRETIKQLSRLKFISVTATGYDIVDIEAAGKRGIPVSNVPVYGTDSVAQFVFAFVLDFCNQITVHDSAVKAGEWAEAKDWCFWKTPQRLLAEKKMGIVGFGRIGRRVGELAHAFQMEVLAFSPRGGALPDYDHFSWKTLPELFRESDIVTLHCPQTAENAKFVNAELISQMKASALLINTSRGGLIDEQALSLALNRGDIAGAGVDVASIEPIRKENPLLQAKNIRITPHIAWSALEARKKLMDVTVENIESFLAGNPVHVVNAHLL